MPFPVEVFPSCCPVVVSIYGTCPMVRNSALVGRKNPTVYRTTGVLLDEHLQTDLIGAVACRRAYGKRIVRCAKSGNAVMRSPCSVHALSYICVAFLTNRLFPRLRILYPFPLPNPGGRYQPLLSPRHPHMSLKAELQRWATALDAHDVGDFQRSLEVFAVSSMIFLMLLPSCWSN